MRSRHQPGGAAVSRSRDFPSVAVGDGRKDGETQQRHPTDDYFAGSFNTCAANGSCFSSATALATISAFSSAPAGVVWV